jgi:hypothetical protein
MEIRRRVLIAVNFATLSSWCLSFFNSDPIEKNAKTDAAKMTIVANSANTIVIIYSTLQ